MTATTERLRVKLTLQQAEQVEWAIGPMSDFWCTESGAEDRSGKVLPESDMPAIMADGTRKTSRVLVLSPNSDVNSDLLYRLEVQLQDMTSSGGDAKAARNAAYRIRHRSPVLNELPRGGGWIG